MIYIYVYIDRQIYIYIYSGAAYKMTKRAELTMINLPLSFETHNSLNIIGRVGTN